VSDVMNAFRTLASCLLILLGACGRAESSSSGAPSEAATDAIDAVPQDSVSHVPADASTDVALDGPSINPWCAVTTCDGRIISAPFVGSVTLSGCVTPSDASGSCACIHQEAVPGLVSCTGCSCLDSGLCVGSGCNLGPCR
jgi:hypothetical protein